MKEIPPPNSKWRDILELMQENGAGPECFVLSYHTEWDGKTESLPDALEQCVGNGMAVVVVSDPERLAYFEAEQSAGSPPRFLLLKEWA